MNYYYEEIAIYRFTDVDFYMMAIDLISPTKLLTALVLENCPREPSVATTLFQTYI